MSGMAATSPARSTDRKLQLREVLDWMVEDGLMESAVAAKLLADARSALRQTRHPAITIGEAGVRTVKPPHHTITAQMATEFIAGRVKMPFYHIDPLKIDLNAVTRVMSSDYAAKRGILPVEVNGQDVTIAVS